jgi:hypothetical protein
MEMTSADKFLDFLNEQRPEEEKILVALRFYVAEVTDDKLPRELQEEMASAASDVTAVESALAQLKKNRGAQVQAAIGFLSDRWEDPGERVRIARAFDGTETKLPVIEAGLIAIVGMYGMFLIATGGRNKVIRTVERGEDGTYREVVVEEMYSPMGPIGAILQLFGAKTGS